MGEERHVCKDCGEVFETGPLLGTHRSTKHKRGPGSIGGGDGDQKGREKGSPVPDLTMDDSIRRSLTMAGVKDNQLDGLVECVKVVPNYQEPEAWSTVEPVLRNWGLNLTQRMIFRTHFYRGYFDVADGDVPPFYTPGPRRATDLEERLRALEERDRRREEAQREAERKAEMDSVKSEIASLRAALVSPPTAVPSQAQGQDELKVLREEFRSLKELLSQQREDAIRQEISNLRAKVEGRVEDPVSLITSAVEKGRQVGKVLGLVEGKSDLDPRIFETANRFAEIIPNVVAAWKGSPTKSHPPSGPEPVSNHAIPLGGQVQYQERRKAMQEAQRKALDDEVRREVERMGQLSKAKAEAEVLAAMDRQRVEEAENLFGPIDTRGLPPHSPEAREGREGSPAVGEGLDIEALKASISERIASGEIIVCPTGVPTFHPVDPSQWLASLELKEKATGESGLPPRSPAGEKPRPPDELPTRQAPLKKAKKARGTQT